ncbi:MAG: formate dehydrogenase accessory sulfurtransferase FdhD [Spirosomaceae bacterium]|jgi:FdhD protein|nr:formate dehydrogenase accessory sulfurtransferase FdhD [Spirosomataceae bacterium]
MAAIKSYEIEKVYLDKSTETPDLVAVEEPLEIRLGFGNEQNRQQKSISVTMRTPTKHDFELALGFLFTEGIIQSIDQILSIHYCTDAGQQAEENIVRAELLPNIVFDSARLQRNFYSNSSCGVCGKASIESLENQHCSIIQANNFRISKAQILKLGEQITDSQVLFSHTGGLHAAALFNQNLDLQILREDVGRHNALDKLIGACLINHQISIQHSLIYLTSRAGFEIVQKVIAAQAPLLVCVGSPTSLAIDLAKKFNLTLIGFATNKRFNIYSGLQRIY